MGLGVMATHRAFLGAFAVDSTHDWERESGVMEVYEAAPRTRWTTEPPTHAGVWWVRLPGYEPKVVKVFADDRSRLVYSWTDIDPAPVPREGLEWGSRAIVEPEG